MENKNLGAQAFDTYALTGCYNHASESFYSMSNGGLLGGVSLNNIKTASVQSADTTQTWGHDTYEDKIYGVSLRKFDSGFLWEYDVFKEELKVLISLPKGHQAWSIAVQDKKNIFVGSYKEKDAKVFKYDGIELHEIVSFKDQHSYARSLAVGEKFLYIGTGQNGRIYQYNLESNKLTEITNELPQLLKKPAEKFSFAYDMFYHDNHLFCRLDQKITDTFAIYNIKEQKWTIFPEVKCCMFKQLPTDDRFVYLILNNSWHQVDYKQCKITNLDLKCDFDPRGGVVKDEKLMTIGPKGQLAVFNMKTKDITIHEPVMDKLPVTLHNLATDTFGNTYISSYPGGTKLIQRKNHEIKDIDFHQVEGFAQNKEKMYLGVYPGARIFELDIESLAYKEIFNLKDSYRQDRPYIMKFVDDLLFIGTIPDYKETGGVLAIYDPTMNKLRVYENLIQDQSIVGLEKKGDTLYISSTIRGGLDSEWSKEKPKIAKFDLLKEKVEKSVELSVPGLSGKVMISGLTFINNSLWCICDGYIIELDSITLDVIKSIPVMKDIKDFGMWKPFKLIKIRDDNYITDIGGAIHLVNLKNNDTKELVSHDNGVVFITKNGNILYYLDQDDTQLKMLDISCLL